ncbi:MAG: formylglycine-generating enzyme family protein, partial [Planctomycetaceae bacterium]|nr:formylglycine-generating enzyme family protein [Planctomycetaceae bacterium]
YNWRNYGIPQTERYPVCNVSWNDAVAFCDWLSRTEGVEYRLPTEAEWEYACRAGTSTMYYHGNDPKGLAAVGNVADRSHEKIFPDPTNLLADDGFVTTSPVGRFRANDFGLYDMHGNVWEWCSDWYSSDYYLSSSKNDPTGPSMGSYGVGRGGAWNYPPDGCRSANRNWDQPASRWHAKGFRVVHSIEK